MSFSTSWTSRKMTKSRCSSSSLRSWSWPALASNGSRSPALNLRRRDMVRTASSSSSTAAYWGSKAPWISATSRYFAIMYSRRSSWPSSAFVSASVSWSDAMVASDRSASSWQDRISARKFATTSDADSDSYAASKASTRRWFSTWDRTMTRTSRSSRSIWDRCSFSRRTTRSRISRSVVTSPLSLFKAPTTVRCTRSLSFSEPS
mmetsp:Transcript_18386/g.63795  ORF Transcript_18386/g.63795 Transcript_18386/m.63795 type:complete len:205 (-) Transcript_18386:3070-3684(-)